MSHVASVKTKPGEPFIVSLNAVRAAAERIGLEVLEQSHYTWYNTHVGDYPVPAGWQANQLGNNATLVLRVKEPKRTELREKNKQEPYDLAVVEDKLNPGSYTLMYDFFMGGFGLDSVIGSPVQDAKTRKITTLAPKFVQAYRMELDRITAKELGEEIEFKEQKDGSWVSYTIPSKERLREAVS